MKDPICSLVIPVYNEEAVLPALYKRLTDVMSRSGVSYEILLVNDGSRDRSWEMMLELRAADPHVSLLNLSRNFGHQIAITAGVEHAQGQAVVVLDADLQDPPEVVLEMLEKWREGYDVVYGLRTQREGESIFKRSTAAAFYRLLRRLTSIEIPVDTGDFRLMSRRVVESMKHLREQHRFVRGLVAWLGFRQIGVKYQRARREAGETKYPLRKMIRFAIDAMVSFSFVPLRLATLAGIVISCVSFAYALVAVYAHFYMPQAVSGWASIMVAILFLGGVQLIFLGIIGEYLGRVYDEVKGRPLYLFQDLKQGPPDALVAQEDNKKAAAVAGELEFYI